MGQRFLYVLSVLTCLTALQVNAAQRADPDPIVLSFAVCAGRFAALANAHKQVAGSDRDMRAGYDLFIDLLAAVGPAPDDTSLPAQSIRAARAASRAETARLIDIVQYGADIRRGRLAQAMLADRVKSCDSLVG